VGFVVLGYPKIIGFPVENSAMFVFRVSINGLVYGNIYRKP